MGEDTNQIEREIRERRAGLGRNLDELQDKARDLADWRTHYRGHTSTFLGVALGAGFLLGLAAISSSRRSDADDAMDPNYADAYYQQALVLMNKVSLDKDGKMVAPPGTTEALQKYLSLRPDGANAEGAKAILEQLGTTVQTSFERPGAPKAAKQPDRKSVV